MAAFVGRTAIVTGGGSGIGRAICRILAREGACVVAADIDSAAAKHTISLLPSSSSSHLAVECNVSNSESVKELFKKVQAEYPRPPTLLANTAGITRDSFIKKMTEQQFDDVISVNLKGTFLMTQAFSRCLLSSVGEGEDSLPGSVVNISSIVARGGNMGQCNYASSKAAVEIFTKTVAKELAKQKVRVNCVVPGFIDTPMVETIPQHLKDIIITMIPMKRMGQPEEIAEVVAFLLSERASYVSGACVDVTGGTSGTM